MKLQQLLPPAKPSPGSRSGRSQRAEPGSPGFAEALSDARGRTTSAKPQENRPAASRPNARAQKDEARPEDAITNEPPQASQEPADVVEEVEPIAETEEGESADGDAAEAESDPIELSADLTAMAVTPLVGPQVPSDAAPENAAAQASAAGAEEIIARPALRGHIATAPAGTSADAETAGAIPLDLDGLSIPGIGDDVPLALEGEPVVPPSANGEALADPMAGVAVEGGEAAGSDSSSAQDAPDEQAAAATPDEMPAVSEGREGAAPPTQGSAAEPASSSTVAPASLHADAGAAKPQAAPATPPPAAPVPTPQHFVQANHPSIVTAVRSELLPNGGTMQIRLDPPELGALQVRVHMQDGVMTASFQTSNDDATRLLSHSLSQLKQVLESQGVSVEKLQVQQAPKDQQPSNQGEDRQHPRDQHDDAHRQEQQRKEMLRRMWRRLANGADPLDLVA